MPGVPTWPAERTRDGGVVSARLPLRPVPSGVGCRPAAAARQRESEDHVSEVGCEHTGFTTGELFDWCSRCGAHRMNETWGAKVRPWVGGAIVDRDPTIRDLLVRLEQMERSLELRLDYLEQNLLNG